MQSCDHYDGCVLRVLFCVREKTRRCARHAQLAVIHYQDGIYLDPILRNFDMDMAMPPAKEQRNLDCVIRCRSAVDTNVIAFALSKT